MLLLGLPMAASPQDAGPTGTARPRAREAGVVVGIFPPGPLNAITDVAGVRVGQVTRREGNGATAIRMHNEDTNNTTGRGFGRSTTWSITFHLPSAPRGKATLRLAIAGAGTRGIDVALNDQVLGTVTDTPIPSRSALDVMAARVGRAIQEEAPV